MIYIVLIVGIGLTVYGYIQMRGESAEFSSILGELEETEELRLVNHTINEEELSDGLGKVMLELNGLKSAIERESRRMDALETRITGQVKANDVKKTTAEDYKEVSEKLGALKRAKTIDQLSKEMEMGKGELQLLEKLRGR